MSFVCLPFGAMQVPYSGFIWVFLQTENSCLLQLESESDNSDESETKE